MQMQNGNIFLNDIQIGLGGTVVNQTCLMFKGGSLEIRLQSL